MSIEDNSAFTIRRLGDMSEAAVVQLADVLIDCVSGGASVGFMAPLVASKARSFWRGLDGDVRGGGRIVLVAEDDVGIVGTVQLVLAAFENQPHRADLAKMLVHRRGRRRGLGARLGRAAEVAALEAGRTVIVLDTVTGSDAERLYRRLGWQAAGRVPDYALLPGGGLVATSFYYRRLG